MENSGRSANTSYPCISNPKPKTIRNKKYIEFIKSLRCCVCGAKPLSDPHHIPEQGHGSKGMKCSDLRAIPLCHLHHVEYHNIGKKSFEAKYKLDYEILIAFLNNHFGGNHESML